MDKEKYKKWKAVHRGGGGAIYGLGFVGALIYYFQHSNVFVDYIVGFLKAIVWPAFLIHKLFTLLRM